MKILEEIKKKKVLILGFGREGISTYKFIRGYHPGKMIGIADRICLGDIDNEAKNLIATDPKLVFHFGENYLTCVKDYDLIIKSPGIPNKLKGLLKAKQKGITFTSQTRIFFELCKGCIVGVTGTKGKSTTASLINHIMENSGFDSILLGNIGKPPLDYLNEDRKTKYYVFELSSHQLSDINKSPHVAVLLNIYPEHLDYYESYSDYVKAKVNIVKFQKSTDAFVCNYDLPMLVKITESIGVKKYFFSIKNKVDSGAFLNDNDISVMDNGMTIFSINTDAIPLSGKHNYQNVMAAILAASFLGVSKNNIVDSLKTFKSLEGRLEKVCVHNTITYVNDTLATIPEATIAAVEVFKNKTLTLILGGFDRGISFNGLGKYLAKRKNILNVILIGDTARKIQKSLISSSFEGEIHYLGKRTMEEVVNLASTITPKNGVVLLSPASTSFDMFKDYQDRGNQFKKALDKL